MRRTGRALGENRSVPEKRRAAGWRLRLWKHRARGAGLGFKV